MGHWFGAGAMAPSHELVEHVCLGTQADDPLPYGSLRHIWLACPGLFGFVSPPLKSGRASFLFSAPGRLTDEEFQGCLLGFSSKSPFASATITSATSTT
jgi:hypothetical protein